MSLCVVALLGGGCGARGGRGGGGGSRRSALVSVVMEKCSRKGSVQSKFNALNKLHAP